MKGRGGERGVKGRGGEREGGEGEKWREREMKGRGGERGR